MWLSTSSDPNEKQLIIDFTSHWGFREFFRYEDMASDFVTLTSGELYYIEIRHREGSGSDHFNLGVEVTGMNNPPNPLPLV